MIEFSDDWNEARGAKRPTEHPNISIMSWENLRTFRKSLTEKYSILKSEQISLQYLRAAAHGAMDPTLADAISQNAVEILSNTAARHEIWGEMLKRQIATIAKALQPRKEA